MNLSSPPPAAAAARVSGSPFRGHDGATQRAAGAVDPCRLRGHDRAWRDFYRCMSSDYNHVMACATAHE